MTMKRITNHILMRNIAIMLLVIWATKLFPVLQNTEYLRCSAEKLSIMRSFATWSKSVKMSAFYKFKRIHEAQRHLKFIYVFDQDVFKNNSEDGVINHLFDNLGTTDKFYVDLGLQTYSESVTNYLWEKKGWDGVQIAADGNPNDARVIDKHFLTAENIVSLLELHNVPKPNFDFLAVDIDYNDYFIAKEIFDAGYRPNLFSMEVNRNFSMHQAFTIKYDARKMWDGTHRFGLSPLAAARLANKYGYSPIYLEHNGIGKRISPLAAALHAREYEYSPIEYEHNAVNMVFVKRARVAEYLKERTGFDFMDLEVKTLLPTYEQVYWHQIFIYMQETLDNFQHKFEMEKDLWDEVDEDGNIVTSAWNPGPAFL